MLVCVVRVSCLGTNREWPWLIPMIRWEVLDGVHSGDGWMWRGNVLCHVYVESLGTGVSVRTSRQHFSDGMLPGPWNPSLLSDVLLVIDHKQAW